MARYTLLITGVAAPSWIARSGRDNAKHQGSCDVSDDAPYPR
jgi:hypothetical protein